MSINIQRLIICAGIVYFLTLAINEKVTAQEVKACKNYTTGEIIMVEAGFPCPTNTVEL